MPFSWNKIWESLGNFQVNVDNWDIILVYIFAQKCDVKTRNAFKFEVPLKLLPSSKQFFVFMNTEAPLRRNLSFLSKTTTIQRDRECIYSMLFMFLIVQDLVRILILMNFLIKKKIILYKMVYSVSTVRLIIILTMIVFLMGSVSFIK